MTALVGIPSGDVGRAWAVLEPFVTQALDEHSGGRYLAADVYYSLTEQQRQIWVAMDGTEILGVVVTEIINYPQLKAAVVFALAGKRFADWFEHVSIIEEWARSQGCAVIEMSGRRGWARRLAWRERWVGMERVL